MNRDFAYSKKVTTGPLAVWVALAVWVVGECPPAASQAEPEARAEARGVVVVEVGEGSALARAGIEPGDVLLSWERLPNPPANPGGDRGQIESVFHWMWLEVEQAPRGALKLFGERAGEGVVFEVAMGLWDGKVRAQMLENTVAMYLKGKELIETGQLHEGVGNWLQVAEFVEKGNQWRLKCWIQLRIGEAWGEVRQWDKVHAAYRSALEEAQEPLFQGTIWLAIGEAHWETEREFDQAREAYARAQEIWESIRGESLALAKILNKLGGVAWKKGDLEMAQGYFERALEIRKKLAPESLDVARSMNSLGNVARVHGNFDLAADYHQRALEITQKLAPGGLEVARSINNLGAVAWNRGDLDQAAHFYHRALEIWQQLVPGSLSVALSLSNLGALAFDRGELDLAADYHQEALEMRQKLAPGSLDVAFSLKNLGFVAYHRGVLDLAVDYHRRALEIRQKLAPGSLSVAASLSNLGHLAYEHTDLDLAAEYYQRVLKISEKLSPGSLSVAASLNNLGNLAYGRGDLDLAAKYYQQTLKISQKLAPDSFAVATSLSNLGNVAQEQGKLQLAGDYYQRTLEIRNRLAPGSLVVAASLHYLGDLALDRGDVDRAADYHQRALDIHQKLAPDSLTVADSLRSLGHLALERGELDRAAGHYQRALEIQQKLAPNGTAEARIRYDFGTLNRKKKQPQLALDAIQHALKALESQVGRLGGSQDIQAGFRAHHRHYYRDTIELLLELNESEQGLYTLEASRAQSFLALLAERDVLFRTDIPEELDQRRRRITTLYDNTQQEIAELNPNEHASEIKTLVNQLHQLHQERDNIVQEIRRASPSLAAVRYPQPLAFPEMQATLDPGTVMLSYSVGDEQTDLFVVARERRLEVHSLPIGEKELSDHIQRFHWLTYGQGSSRVKASHRALGKWLYQILIEPAADRIEQGERLLIVPDGPLHRLPFAALVRKSEETDTGSGRDWQYLVEWKPLHSVLSATVYAELQATRSRPAHPSAGETPILLTAFGDPHYPQKLATANSDDISDVRVRSAVERGLLDFEPLPHSRREVEQISRLYTSEAVRIYLGEEATEERAKSIDRDIRIVHFATHATVDDRFPLNSALALTIPDEFTEGRDNGLLQVWEIFERVRIDADLVVLSACETALGKELSGEGMIGLTRAFQYAGARSVVASLWRVPDATTAELMTRFYRHLRAGKSKDEALRAAQIELIQGPIQIADGEERDASAPYYWAAFQVIGDWQ